jgi:hypothetical protein
MNALVVGLLGIATTAILWYVWKIVACKIAYNRFMKNRSN